MLFRSTSAGPKPTTWRFHFDPAVTAELVGPDCRLSSGGREVWLLAADEHDSRPRRLERGWVSSGYGVKAETSVLVIPDNQMPTSLACVFADTCLSADARRDAVAQLDAQRARSN